MIYLSKDYVLSAIDQLAQTHAFIGITFLVCKMKNLPVGKAIEFPMDFYTREFMDNIYKINKESKFYFQPFQTIKSKQWLAHKYPQAGLQSINTRTFAPAFVHEKETQIWGWEKDYIHQIEKIGFRKGSKTSLPALAIWIYKERGWNDTATVDDVVEEFKKEFNLTQEELRELFSEIMDFPNTPAFQSVPVSWNQLAGNLSSPPDAAPDQEGTLAKLSLENVGPTDYLEAVFAPRLNIITGDNGLGKTFLMDCAWWSLTNTWADSEARPKYPEGSKRASISFAIAGKHQNIQQTKVLYNNKKLTWERRAESTTIPGLIVYALVDGSYAVWDPSKHYSDSKGEGAYIFSRQQVWNGQEGSIEGLIRDWVRWQNSPEKYPFDIFKKVLEAMSPPDIGTLVPGDTTRMPNDSREIPTIKYPYGLVPIIYSSAGIRRIMTLAYLIVWAWYEHKENCKMRKIKPDKRIVIIVDELEAHLHPQWQRTILPALMKIEELLSNELEIQFIISTHSPLIMASTETVFNYEIDKLFHVMLSKEKHDAILEEEKFIKYGQVNSWLTSPIFNLGQARSTEAEKAIEIAKALQLEEEPSSDAVNQAHQTLLKALAQTDAFWPRWIYFAEQHGVAI